MRSILIATGLVAAVIAQNSSSSPCTTGNAAHMIIARASLEPTGTGAIGNVSSRVAAQLPGSNVVAVDYPATLTNYPQSEAAGVAAMMQLVTSYHTQCPNSKMVLMGYSQGAQVTMDVLCGTTETGFATTQSLDSNIMPNIAAVVLMGDPSKAANETFLAGTSTKDGIFPRPNTAACESVKSRIVSYCNANDTFCDSGSSIQVHLSYVQDNGTSAVQFVMQKLTGSSGSTSGSSGSSSGSTNSSGVGRNGGSTGGAAASTNAAASNFHWSGKAFTSGLGAISLGLGFLFLA